MIDDHSPLERLALKFVRAADNIAAALPPYRAYMAIQLRRAALSVYLNLREGMGEYRPLEKAKFYRYSLRSLREAVGCIIAAITLHPELKPASEKPLALSRELAPALGRMARFHGRSSPTMPETP